MAKGKKNESILYRAVRFEIFPSPEEVLLLMKVSANLTFIWNEALAERQVNFEQFQKPIYEKIRTAKEQAVKDGFGEVWEKTRKTLNTELKAREIPIRMMSRKQTLLHELQTAYKEHSVTLFDQINALTDKRAADSEFAAIPRNWQEETLDSLNGSFSSFLSLRKNGDGDAKPPRERTGKKSFYKIPGRSGFKLSGDTVHVSFGKLDHTFICHVPDYQREKLAGAVKLKKFEIFRDERDMQKLGRFWISIAYEIPKPPEVAQMSGNTVYLAIGASFIGVVSPRGSFCLRLPRPDFHWKGESMIPAVEERMARCLKGSRKWKRLASARAKMFVKLGAQQKQHGQYEVVQRLLEHGIHFVVTELKIRSKEGALADASKTDRGGAPFGANWAAQNTGNITNLIAKLAEKAQEYGGSVVKCKPPSLSQQERCLPADQKKICLAQKLKE